MEQQKLGTFYGVGVGPGDPELLTVKAIRTLEACPVLAAPQTASGEMTALNIAKQAANLEGKTLLPLHFTMSRDQAKQHQAHVRPPRRYALIWSRVRTWPWRCWGMCRCTLPTAI